MIYNATRSVLWSSVVKGGHASVAFSVVHLAKGNVVPTLGPLHLDGACVDAINSRLGDGVERREAVQLIANASGSFLGSKIYGQGFILTPAERAFHIRNDKKNGERISPYIGGEEVNTSPTHDFRRYVINFGTMDEDGPKRWPDLLKIVTAKVEPERAKNKRKERRENWWRFGECAPALYRAIAPLQRCLVNSQVSKHLVFAFQPTNRVFSHALNVFPVDDCGHFALLQSRVHEPWARLLSSTMRNDLRYAASDCFETFPFPLATAFCARSPVERAGTALYETRAKYMVDTQQGLTQTYNKLKDPHCTDARIVDLRRLHEAMDRAVLDAYDWKNIEVPPYGTPVTDDERRTLERFEDEVIDRLFALNAERAEEERRAVPAHGRRVDPSRAGRFVGNFEDDFVLDNDDESEREARVHPKSAPRLKVPGIKKTLPSVPPAAPSRARTGGGRAKR